MLRVPAERSPSNAGKITQVFQEAIRLGVEYKANSDDIVDQVMEMLEDVRPHCCSSCACTRLTLAHAQTDLGEGSSKSSSAKSRTRVAAHSDNDDDDDDRGGGGGSGGGGIGDSKSRDG
jgi:hypothetical protein